MLLLLSVLVIACGTNTTATQTDLAGPQVTVTIRFGSNAPPQATVAPYLCGAWITNTTPGFTPGNEIPVYAHFEHNVNGNPVGIGGANAQATMLWADGSSQTVSTTTTGDGLAVVYFTIPDRPKMVNKNNLVTFSFSGPGGETCSVDNQAQPAAFFTLIMVSPTPTPPPSPTPTQPGITPPIIPTIPFFSPGDNPPPGKPGKNKQPTPATCAFPGLTC